MNYLIEFYQSSKKVSLYLVNRKIKKQMKVSQILDKKGRSVFSVTGNVTVFEALKVMGEKNIGALPIIEDDQLKGIFSERDYARKVILHNKSSRETLVSDIMTAHVITVSPDHTIDQCMELMSNRRIRHLPVVEHDKVVGLLSISDLVKIIIEQQKETIQHLQSYIAS